MKFEENFPISKLTTFKVGGVAKYFGQVYTKEDLVEAVMLAKKNKLSIFVIGEGSNVLVSDKPFKGLVIHLTNKDIRLKDSVVTSDGGVKWDDLVEYCVEKKLQGIECLSGIPGTVGAAPYQNIGAYGQELKDTFCQLEAYDTKLNKFVVLDKKECKFGYRDSIFKQGKYKNRYIIFEVSLKLNKNKDPQISYASLRSYLDENEIKDPTLAQVRKAVLDIRRQKLEDPGKIGNAGSFFKNPIVNISEFRDLQKNFSDVPNFPAGEGKVKLFAGWLIDRAGWKGKQYKKVGVSRVNALVLVNRGGGKAEEVSALAKDIIEDVYKKFKVRLESEVQYINF